MTSQKIILIFRRTNGREVLRLCAGKRCTRANETAVSSYGRLHAFVPVFFDYWKSIFNSL
jgi:hypothetical protein